MVIVTDQIKTPMYSLAACLNLNLNPEGLCWRCAGCGE